MDSSRIKLCNAGESFSSAVLLWISSSRLEINCSSSKNVLVSSSAGQFYIKILKITCVSSEYSFLFTTPLVAIHSPLSFPIGRLYLTCALIKVLNLFTCKLQVCALSPSVSMGEITDDFSKYLQLMIKAHESQINGELLKSYTQWTIKLCCMCFSSCERWRRQMETTLWKRTYRCV